MLGTPEGREERLMPGKLGIGGWKKTFPSLGKKQYESIGRGQLWFAGSFSEKVQNSTVSLEMLIPWNWTCYLSWVQGSDVVWGQPAHPGPCWLSDLSKPILAMLTQNEDSFPYSRALKSFPGDFFATLWKKKGWPLKMTDWIFCQSDRLGIQRYV